MDTAPTDGDYVRRFCAHRDEHAFAQLVVRHGVMVSAVGRRICGNAADAEDCLQATFLTLALRATSLRGRDCLAGWLHTVARHVALRVRGATITRRHREQEVAMHQGSVSTPADDDAFAGVLDAALARLPERYRVPILLHHIECRTQEDIARELGLRPETVAVRLSRGREMLRKRLQHSYGTVSLEQLGVVLAPVVLDSTPGSQIAHQALHLIRGTSSGSAPHILQVAHAVAREMALRISMMVVVAIAAAAGLVVAVLLLGQVARAARVIHAPVLVPVTATTDGPAHPRLGATVPALADESWVPDAASGWCAGTMVPLSRAFRATTVLQEPDFSHRTQVPRVQIGSCHATWPTTQVIDGSLLSPLSHAPGQPDSQLQALADGSGWEPARSAAHTIAVVVSPLLSASDDWTPQLLARDGAIITCICDAWTDDAPHRSFEVENRAMAVDLGVLPPGIYTLRFLQRVFHAEPDHPLRYDPTAFDDLSLAFQVSTADANPMASPVVGNTLHHASHEGGGSAWISRSRRARPRSISISLTTDGTPASNAGAVHVGRFPLATWLESHPKTFGDLNALLGLEVPSGPRYIVVIGPPEHPGGGLDICDAFWSSGDTVLDLRVNLWQARPASGRPVIPLLVMRAPEGTWPQLVIDWSLFEESSPEGFSKTSESSLLAWYPGLAPTRGFRWF